MNTDMVCLGDKEGTVQGLPRTMEWEFVVSELLKYRWYSKEYKIT